MSVQFVDSVICLRPFEPEDAQALRTLLNHPDLYGRRSLPWGIPDLDLPLTAAQINKIFTKWGEEEHELHLAICRLSDNRLIGFAGIEEGWDILAPGFDLLISPEFQRQRFGSRALHLIIQYIFQSFPAHVVHAPWVADWNTPAVSFLEIHGFTRVGEPRWAGLRFSRPFNMLAYDLLRSEWEAAGEKW